MHWTIIQPLIAFRLGFLLQLASIAGLPCPLTGPTALRYDFYGVSFKHVSTILKGMYDPDQTIDYSSLLKSRMPKTMLPKAFDAVLEVLVVVFSSSAAERRSPSVERSNIKGIFYELLACLESEEWGLYLDNLE